MNLQDLKQKVLEEEKEAHYALLVAVQQTQAPRDAFMRTQGALGILDKMITEKEKEDAEAKALAEIAAKAEKKEESKE